MSDIKIGIAADVSNAVAGIEKVQSTLVKLSTDLNKSSASMASVNAALLNTANAAKTASFSIQGIEGTIQRTTPKMTAMTSIASSLKSNLLSIISPTQLLVAGITAMGIALYNFINQEREADIETRKFIEGVSQGSKAFVSAKEDVAKLTEQIDQFHKGIGTKEEVVKTYNETLGKLTGKVTDVYEAERLLNANSESYVYAMTARAIANKAVTESQEVMFKYMTNQLEMERIIEDVKAGRGDANYQKGRIKDLQKQNELIYEQVLGLAKLKDQALDFANKSIAAMKPKGLYGDITKESKKEDLKLEPKSVTVKTPKIKIIADGKAEVGGAVGVELLQRSFSGAVQGARPGEQQGGDVFGTLSGRRTPEGKSSFEVEAEKRKQALLELSNIVTSVLSPALDSVFDNIGKGANKVVQSLGNVIKQLTIAVFKALALQTIASLLPGGKALNIGDVIRGVLGGKASGTTAFGGGLTMVGERGPELVNLPSGSSVMPNNQLQAFGNSGINLMPSIAYDGTMFRIFLNRVDAQISRNG